jgi:hypothetical protein
VKLPCAEKITSAPVPDPGPKRGETKMEVELPSPLARKLARTAARQYQCSVERVISCLMRAHLAGIAPVGMTDHERHCFDQGRAFERNMLEQLNGSPVNLRTAREVAHKVGVDVNDLIRGGLHRMCQDFEQTGRVRFGEVLTVSSSEHAAQLRELAKLLELEPRHLLDHGLHFWLKSMTDSDIGQLESWPVRVLKYTKAEQRRILPRIKRWQNQKRQAKPKAFPDALEVALWSRYKTGGMVELAFNEKGLRRPRGVPCISSPLSPAVLSQRKPADCSRPEQSRC